MIKLLFPFLLLLFTFEASFAQNLTGTVRDAKTGETLIGATVVIKENGKGVSTDIDGKFSIANPGNPPFTLDVSYVGYLKSSIKVPNLGPVVIKLNTNEKSLKEVEVIDDRLTEKQKSSPLTVESMDQIAIKQTPAANFYDGLGALKGVDLTASSMGFKVINTRGFNSTAPVRSLQIIDGVDNQAPGLNFSLGNFLGSSELDVSKVDIIVGASSAFYGPNAFNGVISINTKSPFLYRGLSAQVKVGERNMYELALRFADVIPGKNKKERLAYKFNFFYMRALDWMADNQDPTEQSISDSNNPGGYDAVNRYGDEDLGGYKFNYTSLTDKEVNPGLGAIYRDGYWERQLVNYNTWNIKSNFALHYKLRDSSEIIFNTNFGTGATMYQGENRFRLENILFFQNRVEWQKEGKFFLRAYATNESSGDSYDAVVAAYEMQNLSRSNDRWKELYTNSWAAGGLNAPRFKVRQFTGYPEPFDEAIYDALMLQFADSLQGYHQTVRNKVNQTLGPGEVPYFAPGTARFDSALAAVKGRRLGSGGAALFDRSALYHIHGERKFKIKTYEFTAGGNFRQYRPISEGSIFSDTAGTRITNSEFGAYLGIEKKLFSDKLRLNATGRIDKNQNFKLISTQSVSAVYTTDKNHTFRAVFSSAIRNPTLADQYLFYNVGRAILIGNLNGRDSLVTIPSFIDYLNTLQTNKLEYFNVDAVRPEKVKTVEVGYRGTLFKRLFVDASYYYSVYTDFLGFKIGLDVDFQSFGLPQIQAYRISANTRDLVYTQGLSVGLNYYFAKKYGLTGNYSYNILSRPSITDEIITAFNTPLNKFNLGVNGRNIVLPGIEGERLGFSINYKWVQGFRFEGAPQFTGAIPSYGLVDAQVSYSLPKVKSVVKIGASNILNNEVYLVYGGPLIGRLAYASIVVDIPDFRKKKAE